MMRTARKMMGMIIQMQTLMPYEILNSLDNKLEKGVVCGIESRECKESRPAPNWWQLRYVEITLHLKAYRQKLDPQPFTHFSAIDGEPIVKKPGQRPPKKDHKISH